MVQFIRCGVVVVVCLFCFAEGGFAHFGMLIPSQNVMGQGQRTVDLQVSFSHPFELIGMDMQKPQRFYVVKDGVPTDLLPSLQKKTVMEHQGWQASYKVPRPGVYQFIMEPAPYWEPAENLSIIHYTKTIIAAYGGDVGWSEPVGLPVEIVPLLRPFANYAGNSFVGQVLQGGKPAAHVEVEVERYNKDNKVQAVSDYHITQVVKTDGNGVFHFSCPHDGWWGFSALVEAGYSLKDPKGQDKPVELGAVLWIYMDR